MDIPIRMASWRRAKGLSQVSVAKVVGVGSPSVSMWESGACSPTLENLQRYVEDGLHETMQSFFDDEALAAAVAAADAQRASKAS